MVQPIASIEREKRIVSLLITEDIPKNIMHLREKIFDLEKFISPILIAPCEEKLNLSPVIYNCPFEEKLDRISYEINDLTRIINDLINRCQL